MENLITSSSTLNPIPKFDSGTSTYSIAGSSSITFASSTGNVGIGTIMPSAGMTIHSNGHVSLGNINPTSKLHVHSPEMHGMKIRLFDLIVRSANDYNVSGEFASDLNDLFHECGGSLLEIKSHFEKLRDMLINAKIPRHSESPFYDILEEKIRKTQGTGSGYEVIFETIDL
jgi:hypothetical protein